MVYRLITNDERELLTKRGVAIPAWCIIMGAFKDNGDLAGYLISQLAVHMEPIEVFDSFCVRGLIRSSEKALNILFNHPTIHCSTENDSVAGIVKAMGFKESDHRHFTKEI